MKIGIWMKIGRQPRERVDLLGLIKLHHLLLQLRLVVLVALLQHLHLGLHLAHRRHRRELALRDREQQTRTDDHGQADDRDAEIADMMEQPVEQIEDRLFEPDEPAPVDGAIEADDAARLLIGVEHRHFLGTGEEALIVGSRILRPAELRRRAWR
jgi:hypothetical protein